MFRYFGNIALWVYAVLLLVTVLLRLPSFHPDYFQADESLYTLAAQQIVGEASLYDDAYVHSPPLLIWFYSIFTSIFGDSALIAIRIFSCLYIYFSALFFSAMLLSVKLSDRQGFWPGFLFIFLASTPWFAQELNTELMMMLPLMMIYYSFMGLSEHKSRNYRSLFVAGILLAVCVMISYQAILIFLGGAILYLLLRGAQKDELMVLMGGFVFVLLAVVLVLYYNHTLSEFYDLGIRYFVDYMWYGDLPENEVEVGGKLLQFLLFWGGIVILAIIGLVHYRLRFFTYLTVVRQMEMAMVFWFVTAILTIIFNLSRLEIHHFLLFAAPLTFYASRIIIFHLKPRWRFVVVVAILLIPLSTYNGYLSWSFPQSFKQPNESKAYLYGQQLDLFEEHTKLKKFFKKSPQIQSLWILSHQPEQYFQFGLAIEHPYVDFRLVYHRFACMGRPEPVFSGYEEDAHIFQALQANPPDAVLDPYQRFPAIQKRFPSIFDTYKRKQIGKDVIYLQE